MQDFAEKIKTPIQFFWEGAPSKITVFLPIFSLDNASTYVVRPYQCVCQFVLSWVWVGGQRAPMNSLLCFV